MIIIKTKAGDTFVNDREIISVTHDRDKHTAFVSKPTSGTLSLLAQKPIEHVECVNYINEQTGTEWKDTGSEIDYVRREMESLKMELQCQTEITKMTKDRLLSLGADCVNWANYYGDRAPQEMREVMRKRGEESKAYVNHDEDWMYRREWMQKHQKPEQIEADEVARLNSIVEEQEAKIRDLTIERDHLKAQQRFNESIYDPTKDAKPSWWQRFLSWFA